MPGRDSQLAARCSPGGSASPRSADHDRSHAGIRSRATERTRASWPVTARNSRTAVSPTRSSLHCATSGVFAPPRYAVYTPVRPNRLSLKVTPRVARVSARDTW